MRFLDTSRIRTRFDERVLAADGVELSVDLYLPPEPGRYPILLNRTPADNNRAGRLGISLPPAERWKAFAAQGYIVAAADVRGRGDSDGKFIPFVHEADDGAATVAWLRAHDECDGNIGVFGSGYGAFCGWAAAVSDKNVNALASISPFGQVGRGFVHRGGAVRLSELFWMHLIGGRTVQPATVPPWPSIHAHLPLLTMDEALGREDIWWREWLTHLDPNDPFWAPLDLADSIAGLRIRALHVTGWWDAQITAALSYYQAAQRSGIPQRLIIGPWDTAATRRPAAQVGGVDFGPRSVLDLDEILIKFFDECLRANVSVPLRAEANIFVTGRNEWRNQAEWADAVGGPLILHMSSTLASNTRSGDGVLSSEPPKDRSVDVITHNPKVPLDFQPQFVSFAAGANPLGFTLDQQHITGRDEALVYTTVPLQHSVAVNGSPRVTLNVRTSAADADLYVLLSDGFPLGGRDLHLSHSALRLSTLKSFVPGERIRVELELNPIAHDFLPGHHIRLTVVPSLFPLYARNAHGENYVTDREIRIADIELHAGPGAPAYLVLPLYHAEA